MKLINKIFIFLTLLMLSVVSVSAGELLYNQNSLVSELNNNKVGNVQLFDLVGSVNKHLSDTQDYDLSLEYPELKNDIYVYFENTKVNETITLIWNFDLSSTGTRYTQNFTLNEIGTYVFKVHNNQYGEPFRLWIETNDDSYIATLYTQQKINKGIPDVIETLTNKANDLIDINLGIWKVVYYVFIFSVVLSLIIGILLLMAKLYKYAGEHSLFNKRSNHK